MERLEASWNGFLVSAGYEYDPGVWTFSNGDPGYPPSEEWEDISFEVDDVDEVAEFLGSWEQDAWAEAIRLHPSKLPDGLESWLTSKHEESILEALRDSL